MSILPHDVEARLARVKDPEERARLEAAIGRIRVAQERNPIALFRWHSEPQHDFLAARSAVVAAFCGNQFGKSTILVVRSLIECVPEDFLPGWLKPFKRFGLEAPAHGWILCPSEDKIYDSLMPALRKWAPKEALYGGSLDKAFNGNMKQIRFARGDTITFKTYKQGADTLGGATLHFVGYDEPPPREHRDEAMTRLLVHNGYEMFAMTPLKVNTGWIRRDIYRKREDPDITVVRGSMHDNPTIDPRAKERILSQYASDMWRLAREHGDFVDMGGLIFPEWERCTIDPPSPELVRSWDVVVGIDPGIRNAGFAFVGFDEENVATQFDEGLLQDQTPADYASFIRERLSYWGVDLEDVFFVIDPAARSRSQVNAETVASALAREGIYCSNGQNDVDAGVQQLRVRMQHGRWFCSKDCRLTRDQADEYAAEDREDGRFVVVKTNDHCFVAGTMIATEHGERPIESIAAGEYVWTREGLRQVVAAGATDFAPVRDLQLPNGRVLTGTGNHPIWTGTRGWVEMDSLRYGDTLCVWKTRSFSGTSHTAATPIHRSELIACTSGRQEDAATSIGQSGSIITDLSQPVVTSTTGTAIPSTTTLPIWSVCRSRTTSPSTGLPSAPSGAGSTPPGSGRSRRLGTAPRKAWSGIASTATRSGPRFAGPQSVSATSAATASPSRASSLRMPASARTPVSRRGGEPVELMTSIASALSVHARSGSTSTRSRSVAAASAPAKRAGVALVFNLTVEGVHEYFANGVLVHNCLDADRYIAMSRPFDPLSEDYEPDERLGWRPDFAPSAEDLGAVMSRRPVGPMGSFS